MSSNRLSYDKCAYVKEVEQSTSPKINNNYKSIGHIFVKGDHTNVLDFGTRTEVESELRNQTRVNSNCPSKKFNPKKGYKGVKFTPPEVCDINLLSENNLEKPSGPGYDVSKLGVQSCPRN